MSLKSNNELKVDTFKIISAEKNKSLSNPPRTIFGVYILNLDSVGKKPLRLLLCLKQ